jgi:RNA polymerase sigma factor (sigma-70 family)
MEDKKFVEDLIARCHIAWRLFETRYHEKIIKRILFLEDNPFYTNELHQKVMVRIFLGLPKFNCDSELWTWIYKIIQNVLMTHFAIIAKNAEIFVSLDHRSISNSEYQQSNGDGFYDNQDQISKISDAHQISGDSDPSKNLERKESQARADVITRILDKDQAIAFDLRHNKKFSYREIGQVFGISAGAAKKLYYRAVAKMKK